MPSGSSGRAGGAPGAGRREGARSSSPARQLYGVASAEQAGQLGQRGDRGHAVGRARSPCAGDEDRAHAGGARAPDVGLERVADVQRPGGLAPPASASACRKIAGIRLGRADLGRGHRPVEQRRQARSSSRSCSETSQFETTTSRSAALAQRRQRGRSVGERPGTRAPPAALPRAPRAVDAGAPSSRAPSRRSAARSRPAPRACRPRAGARGSSGSRRAMARAATASSPPARRARAGRHAAAARAAAARAASRARRAVTARGLPFAAMAARTLSPLAARPRTGSGGRSRSCWRSSRRPSSTACSPAAA